MTKQDGAKQQRLLQKQTSSTLSGEGGDVVAAASHSLPSPLPPPSIDTNKSDPKNANNCTPHHRSHHSIRGILLIMLGSFSFSVMFLLVKVMRGYNTFTLVFWRSLVQIAISLYDLAKKGVSPLGPDDGAVRFLLVCRAVFGAAAVCAWFFGIQVLPLPDAVTLQFTTPPFAAAFAVCMVGEPWKVLDIVGAVLCLTGVALIAHPTWLFGSMDGDDEMKDDSPGSEVSSALKVAAVLVTTAGAAMAGIAYVCVRKIGDRCDAVVMVLYYGVLSLPVTLLGSGWFLGEWNVAGDFENFTVTDYALLLLMGIAGYGGQLFTNLGLQVETAATATLVTSTQICWTFIFEVLFLHEALSLWSLAGTSLILGYMLIVGVIKMVESNRAYALIEEAGDEEKGILLSEETHPNGGSQKRNGYGAVSTSET